MSAQQRVEWEREVRSLYDGMVRIVVTPTWAKLIDFETTLPSAVEELAAQRSARQEAVQDAHAELQARDGDAFVDAVGHRAVVEPRGQLQR
ncbi:hypothetical protein LX86_003195 [Lentzea aerocolonigenes]|nr:hypothetical protein [Lentzea aerocolonigenes]